MVTEDNALHLPAQTIPVPKLISSQAQAFLEAAARRIRHAATSPAPTAEPTQEQNAANALAFLEPLARRFDGTSETIDLPHGARLYRTTPTTRLARQAEVAYYDIHGGGFTSGGGTMCQVLSKLRAMDYGVEVFAIDYRLAPHHPYPAALDDCLAGWRHVLTRYDAGNVVLSGASAGGNLAAALMLRARDEALPLAAALMLMTPAMDLTDSGDSRHTNRFLDTTLYGGGDQGPKYYLGQSDPRHPYLSPLFGTFDRHWPPTLLTSGTRDLLLSDTVLMHRALRRAGIRAELHITEAGPHGGFMGTAPEDAEIIGECRRFAYDAWRIPT
jgi:acetyl esterase/lipase